MNTARYSDVYVERHHYQHHCEFQNDGIRISIKSWAVTSTVHIHFEKLEILVLHC